VPQDFDNAVRRQTMSLPDLIKQQYADLEPKVRAALTTPEIFSVQRIVLTGCGDSYAAALATRHAFEMLTGIPTEAVAAIELSRLYHAGQLGFAPRNPLVVAVSNSGAVARIAEAVQRVNGRGAFTLGVTSDPESPLGKNAQRLLKLDIPAFESSPGVRTYLVSVLSLLLLAIRMGEVRGNYTMDVAMAIRRDVSDQAERLGEALPEMDRHMLALARRWKDFRAFDFVGAGFDYAAAWYGHAKILEATGRFAAHVNTEDWMHLNAFMRDVDAIGTILVANTTNPCRSRNREVASGMAKLGRPMLIVTDGGKADFGIDCDYVRVPRTKYPITMPLTQFAPLGLLAGYVQRLIGEEDGRGCRGPWSFCAGGAGIRNSEIVIDSGERIHGIA
jgi:fructoselysine-6-P-deglycase FrlB-like protein